MKNIVKTQKNDGQDQKKYKVEKNKELLGWLKDAMKKRGYHPSLEIQDMQNLIDNIAYWYEVKYPNREIESEDGVRQFDFDDIEKLSKKMDFTQLMYRLPRKQQSIIECNYRAKGISSRYIRDDKGKIIDCKPFIVVTLKIKEGANDYFSAIKAEFSELSIYADAKTGQIDVDFLVKKIVSEEDITLDELLSIYKGIYKHELDFTELEDCIYFHECDIELRRRLLQMAALKILYSDRSNPDKAYERAVRFIEEFNEILDLGLTTEEIDKIMNKEYSPRTTVENREDELGHKPICRLRVIK